MTLYVDTSALLKRYIDESDSEYFGRLIASDSAWVTCRVTWVESWRDLGRLLEGESRTRARAAFAEDWLRFGVVEVDDFLCRDAGRVADETSARSLDALHLAAARRLGAGGVSFLTADLRQAQAARVLGFTVLGA